MSQINVPVSLLDLAQVGPGETVREALAHSLALAEFADGTVAAARSDDSGSGGSGPGAAATGGYRRLWYAEHHNMSAIASAAPAVLVARMGAATRRIRLGAGGVMLPNHSPLAIAEQYGTLAELYPDRIDLGLGRAPGGDRATFAALRRDPADAEKFPHDVVELQGYLRGTPQQSGVVATPGAGTDVPLYILGSSLFGAQLAAYLGLPYAFASHFAPAALEQAVALYRSEFRPAQTLDGGVTEPYVIAATTVIAHDDAELVARQLHESRRQRAKLLFARDLTMSDEQADALLAGPAGRQVDEMLRYAATGTPDEVRTALNAFAEHAQADELMLASLAPDRDVWFGTVEALAPRS
ncbi:MAG: LLM class flavin-dependent oxidoreductase [Gordonia sp. (in: high G+C Gram-positive bacteria)]|uniref:LLM class flavin-dependent oxidoreductase n=1 Tax=Gordonia sp. (in: high G+C Gram-positive bacteria) TaxID=84139 RepID=UPI0039E3E9C8